MSQKADIAAWITSTIKARGLNQSKVAGAMKVARATMSRWCNPNDPTMPLWENISALADVLGSAPPGWSSTADPAAALGESGVAPLPTSQKPEDWNGHVSEWRVLDASMQTKGYMPGDTVKADARIQPLDGDVVVANLYATSGRARTVLRVYKAPGYLVPATADAATIEVHEVGKTAAVVGVVFESTRRRNAN
jgi:transcriptional regulator with XRE-family HTH domain